MKNGLTSLAWLRFWMWFSIILLLGFVMLWLRTQYQLEARNLNRIVQRDINESGRELLDSMASKWLPIDSLIDKLKVESNGNTLVKKRLPHGGQFITESEISWSGEMNSSESKSNNVTGKKQEMIVIHNDRKLEDLPLIKDSVVLQVFSSGVSSLARKMLNQNHEFPGFQMEMKLEDTSMVRRILRKNWSTANLNWKLVRKQAKQEGVYVLPPPMANQQLQLINPQKHLYNQVLPELLFSSLLLIVISLAFYMMLRAMKRQRQLVALRTEFISNISHELKTPVSTMQVALEALTRFDRQKDPQVMHEYLGLLDGEAKRLKALVQQVLDASMAEQGGTQLELKNIDLAALIRKLVDRMYLIAKGNQLIEVQSPEHELCLLADALHLEGVVVNLLDNALKYGGEGVCIRVSVFENGAWCCVDVEDNGPGIPPESVKHIFEQFYRVPSGDIHNVKGYGLGLSYSQHIARLHKGELKLLRSQAGKTIFRLSLPKS